MIGPSPREVADKAIFLLAAKGVPQEDVMRCLGITERTYEGSIERVKNGRYGTFILAAADPRLALDVEIDSITPDQVLDVVRALNPTPCEDRPTPKHMAQERGFSGHFDTANGMPTCRASVTLSQASQAAGSPRF